jgi:alpha-L-arabinofuranosidase
MSKCAHFVSVALILLNTAAFGQDLAGTVTIHTGKPGHPIPSGFFGLMTEEINHAYDGGLYAELIRNRSFRDSKSEPVGWSASGGRLSLVPGDTPAIRIEGTGSPVEVSNTGYWGIPVKPNTVYRVTLRAMADTNYKGPLSVSIESDQGKEWASARIPSVAAGWHVYELKLKTGADAPSDQNRFVIRTSGTGSVLLNYASLFPPTFHHRANGLRSDLMEKMAEMKPSFLRMPGGNYLEGNTIPTRFEWKDTLGNPIDRVGHLGPWGYRSSDGLGLLEFLEWCEDLKMKPLLAVYAGYSLEQHHVDPGATLTPFVQDALDEIEYAAGDTSTKWGAQRAKDGHPKPFPIQYVEIGNEDNFDRSRSYDGRFAQFFDAIKARYPKLQLIATMPVESRVPDVIDDHYYRTSADMARDSGHYDNYSRTAPKIFVGEWASTEGSPTPTLQAALGDAAWLTGLERDSDVVVMEAYAPLLVNVNRGASQWGTNLIGYDALSSFGSPSFYMQSMFAEYTGNLVVPNEVSVNMPSVPEVTPHGSVGLATWSTDAEYKDAKVTHDGKTTLLGPGPAWNAVRGRWVEDSSSGAFRQTTLETDTLAVAGDLNWTNYTYELKAKKLGGDEGFLIPFHVLDGDDYWFWNVGGWNNRRTALQAKEAGGTREASRATRMSVETGRWYDIKIEVANSHIRCYLDGKLVTEADEKLQPPVGPIFVAASQDAHGALYLKVVNVSDHPVTLTLNLEGKHPSTLRGLELEGHRSDMNSIQNPTLDAPHPITVTTPTHQFPPRSVTVLKG